MEDDGAVKAPVTRLRRRLSVEQTEDVKSPAPATPTKKRGRLAAKPQLELINENATNTSAKRTTRRASAKENVEEEKPATPSRRSTRIKSNTSIVSETTQTYDSPRAKRAARRNSQIGSDTELPLTPVRQMRRTRKDSTSSIDKLETTLSNKPNNITEIIIEETDSVSLKSDDTQEAGTEKTVPIRKSPRLSGKKDKDNDEDQKINSITKKENDAATMNDVINDMNVSNQKKNVETLQKIPSQESTEKEIETKQLKESMANSSMEIIQELDKKPNKKLTALNKSASTVENINSFKDRRQRSKSLTAASSSDNSDGIFYSDNECTKKRIKKSKNSLDIQKPLVDSGFGDNEASNPKMNYSNVSKDMQMSQEVFEKSETNTTSSAKKKTGNSCSLDSSKLERDSLGKSIIIQTSAAINPQGNKENIHVMDIQVNHNISTSQILEKGPGTILQSTVLFEDSDSDVQGKTKNSRADAGDQCVPVVDSPLHSNDIPIDEENSASEAKQDNNDVSVVNHPNQNISKNYSCEPMDIDVTIPNNISTNDSTQCILNKSTEDKNDDNLNQESLVSSAQIDKSLQKNPNKSKRKSSLSTSQNLEKSESENKSTLILSQIKDTSSTENSVPQSPKLSNETLSKSVNTSGLVNKIIDKKNTSLDYSTSTPLQQKSNKKLGMKINSSVIDTSNAEYKEIAKKNDIKSKNKKSNTSKSSNEVESDSEEEEVSSRSKNDLLDDEADVASDDYESGDSQNEVDRQYEEENEILEKGETLDSDEDMSNDTDYEKDSFVVSSDEEDNDLLSGSGDDLSMSGNELTMSKKSKKKYDARKAKEQKLASKEMYAARHNLNVSNTKLYPKNKKDKKKFKIESSDSSDSEEEITRPIKKGRPQRLDSTHDESLNESKDNKSTPEAKTKKKHLSESLLESYTNKEKEITAMFDESMTENNDPLSVQVKQEPKTPMKGLNISTVEINQDIEHIEMDNNVSMTKTIQTLDPLQATMADESLSSMSENSEIIKGYDSVLNNLKVDHKKNSKLLNLSLNLNKKVKSNTKELIVDQLNLTQTKAPKKNKKVSAEDVTDSAKVKKSQKNEKQMSTNNDNESSDSIDLHLLFSEDSNDQDEMNKSGKWKPDEVCVKEPEDFIPLKRTPGKMNLLSEGHENKNEKHIIVDKEGASCVDSSVNRSLNSSTKKKKKDKKIIAPNDDSQPPINSEVFAEDDNAPDEVFYNNNKKEKKNRKSLETIDNNEVSHLNVPDKKKKKNQSESVADEPGGYKSDTENIFIVDTEGSNEKDMDLTLNTSINRKKNNKKKNSTGDEPQIQEIDTSFKSNATNSAKKHKSSLEADNETTDAVIENSATGSKKRKRSISSVANESENTNQGENEKPNETLINESLSEGSKKKKRKISQNADVQYQDKGSGDGKKISDVVFSKTHKEGMENSHAKDDKLRKRNKKRKERDDEEGSNATKIFKENSSHEVPRLPTSLLNQLEDKPKKEVLENKKSAVISTTSFVVKEARKRKNKPSSFLEESVYLNDTHIEKKRKANIKKPQVLPFVPTAITSSSGFTTNFKINIIPQEVQFVAQTKTVNNFKNDYFYGKNIRRLGTYEMYKRHRSAKMSKF